MNDFEKGEIEYEEYRFIMCSRDVNKFIGH